ncbi:rhodanese-like domain-containing protein [Hymenobacter busanensis]|uniref:Rhodanese-like domain-containing protein n=1 Tax=Hymenobacter busanensis TaxID=2607656 RepID=A0A7L4ZTQ3_9BACT|nr:rhodanese-like domain-containing protein [Hymenobacter busanensis]KAA9339735.1 rhodanese-like domain-containing protein [Hymenobacter busanensis]QHJ06511.1 rhodanese-like domain-containing protein [Hymenobacter busanensis]
MKKLLPYLLPVLLVVAAADFSPARAQTVDAKQAQEMLAKPNTVLLDVRTPDEFSKGHLRGARNVNFLSTDFPDQVAKLDPNATYVLYCASGNRSGKALALMQQNGFKHVVNAGGYASLKEAGMPAE